MVLVLFDGRSQWGSPLMAGASVHELVCVADR